MTGLQIFHALQMFHVFNLQSSLVRVYYEDKVGPGLKRFWLIWAERFLVFYHILNCDQKNPVTDFQSAILAMNIVS